jgi:dTDP-4-dehydrorhamnose 3,5-epimerase
MNITVTPSAELPEVKLLQPRVFSDDRGVFLEFFSAAAFEARGLGSHFVQDNFSFSRARVLRGLHYQLGPGQAKLVLVVRGRIMDVAVDIRLGSPTFGRFTFAELSADNKLMVFMPVGFAHGFYALEDSAVIYKCSDVYRVELERGIAADDPQLGIPWPDADPLLSSRDREHPRLSQVPAADLFRYQP